MQNLPEHHPAARELERHTADLRRTLRAARNETVGAMERVWLDAGLRQEAADLAEVLKTLLAGTAELAHQHARVESARRARAGDTW